MLHCVTTRSSLPSPLRSPAAMSPIEPVIGMRFCENRKPPWFRKTIISQQIYNLLVRQLDVEYFKFTARHPIHTTVYNPLAGGLLTGRHHKDGSTLDGSRFAGNKLYKNRYWTDAFFAATARYAEIAKGAGMSLVELAYAWVAQRKGIDSILVGPGTVEHLDAAIDACQKKLEEGTLRAIDEAHYEITGTDATYAR